MGVDEVQVGRNLARVRAVAGLSQTELGDRMRARGWQWSQATVWSVERGDRPLRLREAADLGELLGLGIRGASELLRAPAEVQLHLTFHEARVRWDAIAAAVESFLDAQLQVAFAADDAEPDGPDRLGAVDWVTKDPHDAVRDVLEADFTAGRAEADKLREAGGDAEDPLVGTYLRQLHDALREHGRG